MAASGYTDTLVEGDIRNWDEMMTHDQLLGWIILGVSLSVIILLTIYSKRTIDRLAREHRTPHEEGRDEERRDGE